MTHRERVEAVLAGRRPDHPPVCFWHHFPPAQASGAPAIEAHVRFLETYDLDFLKVMNDHLYPRGQVDVLRSVEDLRKIRPLPGDAGGFSGQLEVLRGLRQRLGPDVLMCTTLFNAWTVLRRFTASPSDKHGPPRLDGMDERDDALTRLLKEDRAAFKAALDAVSDTLAAFAAACLEAGADGIFLSVRDDWVDRPENGAGVYAEMVRPTDLKILKAVANGKFNVLHVCGRPNDLKAFNDYPVQVINWADRAAGPAIADVRDWLKPVIAGGVDNLNTLPKGTPEDCANEVRDALRQAGNRPIIIAAGCTFDPDAVPAENLRAVVAAARNA
ncbi:MAG: hypothetical protein GXW89_04715 [Phycisphaerae bacterium]|nr:hypothetical protein [Phycisphaerae bacterium]